MKARRLHPVAAALRHVFLLLTSIFMLMPFVWMILMSLRSPADMFSRGLRLLPRHFYAVENYTAALTKAPLLHFMANSAFVCGTLVIVQAAVAMPCAYALAKLRFRGRKTLFGVVSARSCCRSKCWPCRYSSCCMSSAC